ncbi:hypothetical protein HYC85_025648 [Camellia sinensis]|uniref:Uncharacterized protein n=1 Tax=Camellia sinensis TaxID=4442 RepID=A0A7J7GBL2_CAMSI|nr:hypothetical protein HYC85_025648 [Camellia sinensis]
MKMVSSGSVSLSVSLNSRVWSEDQNKLYTNLEACESHEQIGTNFFLTQLQN